MQSEIRIPNKSLFKLDEVCSLSGIKPYVLRFWESEFEEISPIVSSTGQKLFEHSDIEAVLQVKELLFDRKLTIDQAKIEFKKNRVNAKSSEDTQNPPVDNENNKIKSLLKMELGQKELVKLVEAKVKIEKILTAAKTIKHTRNWS